MKTLSASTGYVVGKHTGLKAKFDVNLRIPSDKSPFYVIEVEASVIPKPVLPKVESEDAPKGEDVQVYNVGFLYIARLIDTMLQGVPGCKSGPEAFMDLLVHSIVRIHNSFDTCEYDANGEIAYIGWENGFLYSGWEYDEAEDNSGGLIAAQATAEAAISEVLERAIEMARKKTAAPGTGSKKEFFTRLAVDRPRRLRAGQGSREPGGTPGRAPAFRAQFRGRCRYPGPRLPLSYLRAGGAIPHGKNVHPCQRIRYKDAAKRRNSLLRHEK